MGYMDSRCYRLYGQVAIARKRTLATEPTIKQQDLRDDSHDDDDNDTQCLTDRAGLLETSTGQRHLVPARMAGPEWQPSEACSSLPPFSSSRAARPGRLRSQVSGLSAA